MDFIAKTPQSRISSGQTSVGEGINTKGVGRVELFLQLKKTNTFLVKDTNFPHKKRSGAQSPFQQGLSHRVDVCVCVYVSMCIYVFLFSRIFFLVFEANIDQLIIWKLFCDGAQQLRAF